MRRILNWGIIGLGNIAYQFAKSFYNTNNSKLIAVASHSRSKLDAFQEKFKINNEYLFNDYNQLIEKKYRRCLYCSSKYFPS